MRPLRWRLHALAAQQRGEAVGSHRRCGATRALPICEHPAHGCAPPAVGTPGAGGEEQRQRRWAAPWPSRIRLPGFASRHAAEGFHISTAKLCYQSQFLRGLAELSIQNVHFSPPYLVEGNHLFLLHKAAERNGQHIFLCTCISFREPGVLRHWAARPCLPCDLQRYMAGFLQR